MGNSNLLKNSCNNMPPKGWLGIRATGRINLFNVIIKQDALCPMNFKTQSLYSFDISIALLTKAKKSSLTSESQYIFSRKYGISEINIFFFSSNNAA